MKVEALIWQMLKEVVMVGHKSSAYLCFLWRVSDLYALLISVSSQF